MHVCASQMIYTYTQIIYSRTYINITTSSHSYISLYSPSLSIRIYREREDIVYNGGIRYNQIPKKEKELKKLSAARWWKKRRKEEKKRERERKKTSPVGGWNDDKGDGKGTRTQRERERERKSERVKKIACRLFSGGIFIGWTPFCLLRVAK